MSSATNINVKCPKCGNEQKKIRYGSINNYDKELFSSIIDKSVFSCTCEKCKENIFDDSPLLFHYMGGRDIQIGYKIMPYPVPMDIVNPFMRIFKESMGLKDISEKYDDLDKFCNRVKEICDEYYLIPDNIKGDE